MPVTPQLSPQAPLPQASPPGPQGAPMAQASPNDGSRQMGMVQLETAIQMIEQALPSLGAQTEEHAAAVKALSTLSKVVNRQKSKDLVPAQIAEMARAQQASPISQMLAGGAAGGAPQAQPMPAAAGA